MWYALPTVPKNRLFGPRPIPPVVSPKSAEPPPDEPAALRFAFSGDAGSRFAPLPIIAQAADEQADFLLWFGDTIYADDPAAASGIATTLEEYREKYRGIRSDPYFQEALATLPVWIGGPRLRRLAPKSSAPSPTSVTRSSCTPMSKAKDVPETSATLERMNLSAEPSLKVSNFLA